LTTKIDDKSEIPASSGFRKKLVVLLVLVAVVAVGYVLLSDILALDALAEQESRLRGLQREHPLLAYGIAFLIYVAVAGLSLPGATALTVAYGWFFGLVPGVILVSFASSSGATIAFLLSRYLFRDAVYRRFADLSTRFDDAWRRDGPYFLLTLRLVVVVPFFVINLVMGLTPIRTRTFWWVSQLGMLPGTAVYVYAGSSVPSLDVLAKGDISAAFAEGQFTQLLIALAVLGLFPLVVRWTLRYFGIAATIKDSNLNATEATKP
jgi:uncharacterized membrane protein YdjX (TVP38/TMEM64 family)